MKVTKVELCIIDFDSLGEDEIKDVIENQRYPNWCISPTVAEMKTVDIGEWEDDNPLNCNNSFKEEYDRLFNKDQHEQR